MPRPNQMRQAWCGVFVAVFALMLSSAKQCSAVQPTAKDRGPWAWVDETESGDFEEVSQGSKEEGEDDGHQRRLRAMAMGLRSLLLVEAWRCNRRQPPLSAKLPQTPRGLPRGGKVPQGARRAIRPACP